MLWLVVALIALSVALLGVSIGRRRTRIMTERSLNLDLDQPGRQTDADSRANDADESVGLHSCPVCLAEYPESHRFCARDGAPLVDGRTAGLFSAGMICPTCRRGYPSDASYCPEDADQLVPYGLFGASSSMRAYKAGDSNKICPECGVRHAAAHSFCCQDGAELVVVN